MRINEGFELFEIGGVSYVLPYGQNIADHKKGFRLNESGLILWKGISEGLNESELVERLAVYYEAEPHEIAELQADVEEFLTKLKTCGILKYKNLCKPESVKFFTIGNIGVSIISPADILTENFSAFECSKLDMVDLSITIRTGYPTVTENGQLLLRNRELCVLKISDKYIFLFPEAKQIIEGHLSIDGKVGCFYIRMPYTKQLKEDLHHAIRLMYLYKAQLEGMYAVHSASILYKEKVWLFSAPSGIGKSTHTNLWHELYQTPLINGDLNMLAIEEGKPVVHGIPWCGTSEIFDNKSYPLGGIVFLRRGDTNECEELMPEEKALSLMHRMISPTWSADLLKGNLQFSERIAGMVPIYRLSCTKEPEAAKTLKKWIDSK